MKQPEALRLADELNASNTNGNMCDAAAAELRRLHEVNAELVEALQAVTNMGNRSLQLIYESREAADKAKIALHKAQGEIALQRLNKAAEDNGEEL